MAIHHALEDYFLLCFNGAISYNSAQATLPTVVVADTIFGLILVLKF